MLETDPGAEVTITGGSVRVTVDVNELLVIIDQVMLELFKGKPIEEPEVRLNTVETGLDNELLPDVLGLRDGEELNRLFKVLLSGTCEELLETVALLASAGGVTGLERLLTTRLIELDSCEEVRVLKDTFIEGKDGDIKGVLPRFDEVLDMIKEVIRSGTTLAMLLVMLDDDKRRAVVEIVAELEPETLLVGVLERPVLGKVSPAAFVEEIDVMLDENEGSVVNVPIVEPKLPVDTTELSASDDGLRVVTLNIGVEEVTELLESSSLDSTGKELPDSKPLEEEVRVDELVGDATNVLKGLEDSGKMLVEGGNCVEVDSVGNEPRVDAARLVDGGKVESGSEVLGNVDSERRSDTGELPEPGKVKAVVPTVFPT